MDWERGFVKFSEFEPTFKIELESSEETAGDSVRMSKELAKCAEWLNHYLAMLLVLKKGNFVHPAMLGLAQAAGQVHAASIAASGPPRVIPPGMTGRA